MRVGYFKNNPLHEVWSFRNEVFLVTYGDDNEQSISDSVIEWYNQLTLIATLGEYGITYTAADKTDNPPAYRKLEDTTFLKRQFKFDTDVGAWMAPLDESSIHKMLMVGVVSKSIPIEEQAIQCVGQAVREYFHYGRDKFEEMRALLKEGVEECGLTPYVEPTTFPTWEEEYAHFWDNSVKRSFN